MDELNDGFNDRPAKRFGDDVSTVNEKFTFEYPSNEYTFAFQPSKGVSFLIVEESIIEMRFSLFKGFVMKLKVPFPFRPIAP